MTNCSVLFRPGVSQKHFLYYLTQSCARKQITVLVHIVSHEIDGRNPVNTVARAYSASAAGGNWCEGQGVHGQLQCTHAQNKHSKRGRPGKLMSIGSVCAYCFDVDPLLPSMPTAQHRQIVEKHCASSNGIYGAPSFTVSQGKHDHSMSTCDALHLLCVPYTPTLYNTSKYIY